MSSERVCTQLAGLVLASAFSNGYICRCVKFFFHKISKVWEEFLWYDFVWGEGTAICSFGGLHESLVNYLM